MERRKTQPRGIPLIRNGVECFLGDDGIVRPTAETSARPNEVPQKEPLIVGGVGFVKSPDGRWTPQTEHQQLAAADVKPAPVLMPQAERDAGAYLATGMSDEPDLGETAFCKNDIEELRRLINAAPDAHAELDRRAEAARLRLEEQEAKLALREAEKQRRMGGEALNALVSWEPDAAPLRSPTIPAVPKQASVRPVTPTVTLEKGPLDEQAALDAAENAEEGMAQEVKRSRKLRKPLTITALILTGVLGAGGTAAAVTGYPAKWLAGNQQSTDLLAPSVAAVPLSAAKEQLLSAFGGCMDGNGPALLSAKVVSATDVTWPLTQLDKKPSYLEGIDPVTKREIKPIIKLTDAKAEYTACVVAADHDSALMINGDTITVNEDKVSPQGEVTVDKYRSVLMLNEKDDSTIRLVPDLIAALVNGDANGNNKAIAPEEGKRLTDAFNADANNAEEARLAAAQTAAALGKDNDIYAQQAKAAIDAAIKQALQAKVKELHDQGAISTDAANIQITGTLSRPIVMKNNPTPAPNMPFTVSTGNSRVLSYDPTIGASK